MTPTSVESALIAEFMAALGRDVSQLTITGEPTLDSRYAVSSFATAAIAAAGLAAGGVVSVDRTLADAWFGTALRPVDFELPSPWDSLAGDYRSSDGWVRVHTNAPHHRLAAILALDVGEGGDERARLEAAVAGLTAREVENEIVAASGAAAELRSPGEWAQHPQGVAVASEPLIDWTEGPAATRDAGFKVLDLTRVIAGPVATRFLAGLQLNGLGADVLRIDPPDWNEPAVSAEMTLGKRAARMNVHDAGGLRKLSALIAEADVIVHGYRADALDRLGLGDDVLFELNPGIVNVAINAYGWTGPWRNRRGFDSLVQMSSGIAYNGTEKPTPLPVQALDHATGYLAAAAALEGLRRRRESGRGSIARLSLARTALALPPTEPPPTPPPTSAGRARLRSERGHFRAAARWPAPTAVSAVGGKARRIETTPLNTPWGEAELLASPLTIDGNPLRWQRGPRDLGADKPTWDSVPNT